jgi:hypothetical protein
MSRIQFLRSALHSDTLISELRNWDAGLEIVTSVLSYDGDGNVGQWQFLNLAATIRMNPGTDVLGRVRAFEGLGDGMGGGGPGADVGVLWASVNVTYC